MTRWRVSSSVSRTGRSCRRRCRPRCAHTSDAACRRIPDSGCRPSATSGWRWRARSRRLFRRRPRQRVWPQWRRVALVGVAAIIASGAIVGTLVWVAVRPRADAASCLAPADHALGYRRADHRLERPQAWPSRRTVPASLMSATKARRSSSARSTPSRRWRYSPAARAGCSFRPTGNGSDSWTASAS